MFTINIDGVETECELNLGSAIDYELEFGSDMVADMNGKIKEGDAGFLTFETKKKSGKKEPEVRLVAMDFTAVSWTTLVKVLWIAARTRNPNIESFKKWAENARGVDLMQARVSIAQEMDDCFFRDAPVEQTQEGADEQ